MNLLYLIAGLFVGSMYHEQVGPLFSMAMRAIVQFAAAHQGAGAVSI